MRELKDELEVPGTVVMHKITTERQLITEARNILDKAEANGISNTKDLPEKYKQRLFEIFKELNLCKFCKFK